MGFIYYKPIKENQTKIIKERVMKKNLFYILMLLVLVVAACAPAAAPEEPAAPAGGDSMSERCGDTSKLAETIYLYTWVEYIDPEIKDMFKEECGVEVVETNFDSNETLLATLQAGGSDYDIVVPSDYMVQIMIDEGMLMPLDFNVVTNIKNMDPLNVNQYFDPEQKYTVP